MDAELIIGYYVLGASLVLVWLSGYLVGVVRGFKACEMKNKTEKEG